MNKITLENELPEIVGQDLLVASRYGTYILYMPIKMKDKKEFYHHFLGHDIQKLINIVVKREDKIDDKYVYISLETSFVEAGKSQKRPGWHIDGFLTNDVNYLWYSNTPTIFNKGKFELDLCHEKSIKQMSEQAKEENNVIFASNTLLRLTNKVVHKTMIPEVSGVRTFCKVSISENKYNLKGNTKNPLISYDWMMYDRSQVRNHPIYKENDSIPDNNNL